VDLPSNLLGIIQIYSLFGLARSYIAGIGAPQGIQIPVFRSTGLPIFSIITHFYTFLQKDPTLLVATSISFEYIPE
jgi:hypothetical protein